MRCSPAKLHIIRARLDGGIRNKAARGELRRGLPVGFIWGEQDGEVLFHPDEAVNDRWQSARDLKWELRSVLTVSLAAPARPRYWVFGAALGLLAFLLVGLAVVHFSEAPPRSAAVRTSILLPEKSRVRALEVSPDGRQIAMVLVQDGKQQIWVRALDALEPAALAGTDGANDPFWSPDSRFIGFFADAKLKKIHRSGGPVQILCDALAASGGTWNSSGDILFGGLSAVERVSASVGKVTELPGRPRGLFPVFLPDGRHFLAFEAYDTTQPGIWLHAVGSAESRQVLADSSKVEVVDAPPGSRGGALLFTRAGTLMSLPFDMKGLAPAGSPYPSHGRWHPAAIAPGWPQPRTRLCWRMSRAHGPARNTCGAIASGDTWAPRAAPVLLCASRPMASAWWAISIRLASWTLRPESPRTSWPPTAGTPIQSGRRMASTSLSVRESAVGESIESRPAAPANGNR